jgi:hypothetical protein
VSTTDRDVYVAELEHENATLRAELDRQEERGQDQTREQGRAPAHRHHPVDHCGRVVDEAQTPRRQQSVEGDSLRLRFARLIGLR